MTIIYPKIPSCVAGAGKMRTRHKWDVSIIGLVDKGSKRTSTCTFCGLKVTVEVE